MPNIFFGLIVHVDVESGHVDNSIYDNKAIMNDRLQLTICSILIASK